jgi:hypothetical protein
MLFILKRKNNMILNDAIIPYHGKDESVIKKCCEALQDIVEIKRIFIIADKNPNVPNTIFINEKELTNIIDLNEIKNIWNKNNEKLSYRSGWIYQQLIKLGCHEIIPDLQENFLVCDSDIIFLNNPYKNLSKNIFPYSKAYTGQYHEPYRKNYVILMKEECISGISFINHHMIFNINKLNKLKDFIEQKNDNRWDLAIINSLNFSEPSNFSEYDLYGNWIFKYHNDDAVKIDIKILDVNFIPDKNQLNNIKQMNYDIVSCQAWMVYNNG